MQTNQPSIGDRVEVQMTKWDGSAHWHSTMTYLGADTHGRWLGALPGGRVSRPGAAFTTTAATVKLVPGDGDFLASFNAPPSRVEVYTDITTTPSLELRSTGWVLTAVDLDLDVVRLADGRTWIDDEDEFTHHTRLYGYPAQLVATARATADGLLPTVRDRVEPFGDAHRPWLNQLQTSR